MQKTPSGGLTQAKKKREREREREIKRKKIEKAKEKNNNRNKKKDSTNKKCFSYDQMGHFCRRCPAKQRQQAVLINVRWLGTGPPFHHGNNINP